MQTLIADLRAALTTLGTLKVSSVSVSYARYQKAAAQAPDNWNGCLMGVPLIINATVEDYRIEYDEPSF